MHRERALGIFYKISFCVCVCELPKSALNSLVDMVVIKLQIRLASWLAGWLVDMVKYNVYALRDCILVNVFSLRLLRLQHARIEWHNGAVENIISKLSAASHRVWAADMPRWTEFSSFASLLSASKLNQFNYKTLVRHDEDEGVRFSQTKWRLINGYLTD